MQFYNHACLDILKDGFHMTADDRNPKIGRWVAFYARILSPSILDRLRPLLSLGNYLCGNGKNV